jgi:ABC-2 type transport system ATP-binding protein
MASTLTHNYQILDHQKEGNITTVKLKLLNDIPTNDLIRHFTALGNVISFNEHLPSMNDIFIDVVGETNKQMVL